jgi:DNA-binding protein H-NS
MATVKSSSTPATLKTLEAQISALQAQAEELRRTETADVVARIKEAIAYYELSAQDLGLASASGRKPGPKTAPPRAKPAKKGAKNVFGIAKYTNGAGKTWTGRGKRPQWYVDALASGRSPEDMLIEAAA